MFGQFLEHQGLLFCPSDWQPRPEVKIRVDSVQMNGKWIDEFGLQG